MCELHVAIHNRKFPDLRTVFCLRDVNRSYVLPEDKDSRYPAEVSAQQIRKRFVRDVPHCSLHKYLSKIRSVKFFNYSFYYINVLESTPLQR
jgi:hypothetical protein